LAWLWATTAEPEESKTTIRRADRAKQAGYEFPETRERCFISPNDILEREFRTFIVSG
jgi:hypothetical protein